jgi:hypothetical protein
LKHLSTNIARDLVKQEQIDLNEVGFEITVSTLMANHFKYIPSSYYAGLRSREITRLISKDFGDDGNLEEIEELDNSIGLIISTNAPNCYSQDSKFRICLKEGNIEGFLQYLKTQSIHQLCGIFHNSIWMVRLLQNKQNIGMF